MPTPMRNSSSEAKLHAPPLAAVNRLHTTRPTAITLRREPRSAIRPRTIPATA